MEIDSKVNDMEAGMARKKMLTQQAVAAIAAGAEPAAVVETLPDAPEIEEGLEANATLEQNSEESNQADVEGVPDADSGKAALSVAAPSELVAYLQAQVAEGQAKVAELVAENKELSRKATGLEAHHSELCQIVAARINHMRIALGGSAMDLSRLPAETLLAEHAVAERDFTSKFPVGGKAALPATEPETRVVTTNMDAARRRAIRPVR